MWTIQVYYTSVLYKCTIHVYYTCGLSTLFLRRACTPPTASSKRLQLLNNQPEKRFRKELTLNDSKLEVVQIPDKLTVGKRKGNITSKVLKVVPGFNSLYNLVAVIFRNFRILRTLTGRKKRPLFFSGMLMAAQFVVCGSYVHLQSRRSQATVYRKNLVR